MCYSGLGATDLVSLEFVSRRMRELVATDDVVWRECAKKTWGEHHCLELMSMAAVSAGGWKQLYAGKTMVEALNAPWSVPCEHEVNAIMERMSFSILSYLFFFFVRPSRAGLGVVESCAIVDLATCPSQRQTLVIRFPLFFAYLRGVGFHAKIA